MSLFCSRSDPRRPAQSAGLRSRPAGSAGRASRDL